MDLTLTFGLQVSSLKPNPNQNLTSLTRLIPSESTQGLSSVLDWLVFAQDQLTQSKLHFGHGYLDAQAEAISLVSHALQLNPADVAAVYSTEPTEVQRQLLFERLNRRCTQRLPLAYVNGEITFHGRRFLCDQRALIPRSLIAELLDTQLAPWLVHPDQVRTVLDLCTGGASLAIFAHEAFPAATVWASDISGDALSLASENLALHRISAAQIKLIESDLFAQLGSQHFDLIISNPPYVNADSMAALPTEFLVEPDGALGGGTDGMDIVKRIIRDAQHYLKSDGLLIIEIGHEADHFSQAFSDYEFAFLPVEAGDDMVVALTLDALNAGHKRLAQAKLR